MTRSELIARLAKDHPSFFQRDIEKVVVTLFDEIISVLSKGDRVELRGFGTFSAKKREPHTGRNPRTGQAVKVTQKVSPAFRMGKELREKLNKR